MKHYQASIGQTCALACSSGNLSRDDIAGTPCCADYFHDTVHQARERGGQRIATMLMYLSTVPLNGGGETTFPDAKYGQVHRKYSADTVLLAKTPQHNIHDFDVSRFGARSASHCKAPATYSKAVTVIALCAKVSGEEWSDCARDQLSLKTVCPFELVLQYIRGQLKLRLPTSDSPNDPNVWSANRFGLQEKGDGLLFFSLHLDATLDSRSLHGSCPTTAGQKYSLTKWMHVYPTDGYGVCLR